MPIEWDVSEVEADLITQIVDRAARYYAEQGAKLNRRDLAMDVTAVHRNGCPLKLRDLLAADDFDFAHDIAGIRRHIDRETGTLSAVFLPRCAL